MHAGGGVRPGTESLGPWGFADLAQQSQPLRLGLLRREGGRGGTAGLGRRDVSADTFSLLTHLQPARFLAK